MNSRPFTLTMLDSRRNKYLKQILAMLCLIFAGGPFALWADAALAKLPFAMGIEMGAERGLRQDEDEDEDVNEEKEQDRENEDSSDAEEAASDAADKTDAPESDPAAAKPIEWLKDFQWRSIGPTATGGRVVDIEVDPQDPHHILVASAAGGLWETKNNGTTWNCIFENEGTISIGDIAMDPKDVKTIWIGSGEANNQRSSLAGDGVYKTTDGGKTWKNLGLQDTHHIGRVVIDPQDSNTVYVAALGHLYSANTERGLFKTSDGGKTWDNVLYISPEVGVVDVMVHPENSQIVVAASYERLRQAWNFDGNGPGSAIHRSADGGKTWTRASDIPGGDIGRIGLAYFAGDPQVMFATVSNQNLKLPTPAKKQPATTPDESDNTDSDGEQIDKDTEDKDTEDKDAESDGDEPQNDDKSVDAAAKAAAVDTGFGFHLSVDGESLKVTKLSARSEASQNGVRNGDVLTMMGGTREWTITAAANFLAKVQPGDRIQWVFARGDEFRSVTLSLPRPGQAAEVGGEIYRSDDAGMTWKKTNRQAVGGFPPYYYGQITVDPQDQNRIYVMSVPVYVSSDGGKTFRQDGAPSVHVDHHAFWVNPKNSNHLMLGNDGGFHISYDRGKTWDYVFNLPLAQFYAITADNQQPYHVYGGLQDNGSWGGPSEGAGAVTRESWYQVGGGDGFYVQVDPNDHNIVFSESQFGAIGRQNRATGERAFIRPPQSAAEPGGQSVVDRYNWNSPILMSQHDPRTIYFAGNKLFMSFNRGDDWLTISPDLTTNDPTKVIGNVPHCTITTIAESPLDKNYLLVGTDDGKVHITKNRGESWSDISNGFPLQPNRWWCSRVEFSHANKDTAYVSFTGYREDDFRPFVFKTTDAGATWNSIVANLPMENVNVIKQDPRNPAALYVGTEQGVFLSRNDGQSWESIPGLPRVSVQDLLIHPRERDLIVGTHGRGIFIVDDVTPLQETVDAKAAAHLFSIRDWVITRPPAVSSFAGDRKRPAPNSQAGVVIWYQLSEAVEAKNISLVILDKNGKEVSRLKPETTAGWHRVMFPESSGGGRGRARRGRAAGSAGPGDYRAVLQLGDQRFEQPFSIRRAE